MQTIIINTPGPQGPQGPQGPSGSSGGGGTPGGLNTQIQYNSGSTFAGSSNFTYDYDNNFIFLKDGVLTLTGSVGAIPFKFTTPDSTITFGQARTGNYDIGLYTENDNQIAVWSSNTPNSSDGVFAYSDGKYNYDNTLLTHSFTGSVTISGSLLGTASYATTASYALNGGNINTSSFATTGSNVFYGIQYISSSIPGDPYNIIDNSSIFFIGNNKQSDFDLEGFEFTSGSNGLDFSLNIDNYSSTGYVGPGLAMKSGSSWTNIIKFENNDNWTDGRVMFETPISASAGITGSLYGTSSWAQNVISSSYALTASFALNGGGGSSINTSSFATTGSNQFIGNQIITGSVTISGSFLLTGSLVTNDGLFVQSITASFISASSITASLFGTSSWATNSITASNSDSASNALVTNTNSGASHALVVVSSGTTGVKSLFNTTSATIGVVPSLGRLTATTVTASLFGTSSWASNALTASTADTFTVRNNLTVTGSLTLTGSATISNAFSFGVNASSGTSEIRSLASNFSTDFLGTSNDSGSFNFYGGGAYNTGAGITVGGPKNVSYGGVIVFWRPGFTQNGRFTSNGNLILGTGTSDTGIKLDVSGDGRFTGNLTVSGSTFIGDATTDTITMTATTMSLGSGVGILNIDSNTFVVDGANNRVGVGKVNPNSTLDINGNVTLSGSLIFAPSSSLGSFNGEIVQFGAGTLTIGQLYFLSSSGTWSLANANSTGSSTGMLGIAVGSSPTTNGLLIRGFAASSSYTYGTGSVVYMATGSGIMTATSPSSSNHVVRVMGYQTTISNTIYFDPDKTWVTLA